MKRVTLKESHAPYTLTLEEEALSQELLILERDGEPVAALIPMAEYEAFRAWRESRDREEKRRKDLEAFERERQAFEHLKPELLRTHRGRCVAILDGQVVESGSDKMEVLDRVYERFGYRPVYVQWVEEQPHIYKIPHRKVVR